MIKSLALALFAGLSGTSCAVHIYGLHSDYKRLTPTEQAQIHFVPAGQSIPPRNGQTIYAVAASSLRQAMLGADTTLVYIWGPRCHSQQCASLQSMQTACNQRGYRLFVVAEYYDLTQINLQPTLQNPLLAVNHRFYQTDYCNKYVELFTAELRQGAPLAADARYARYYLFKGDRFVKALNALADTRPQFPSFQPARLPNR